MKHVILLSATTLIILVGILFYFVAFGVPVHDVRMWVLKNAYSRVQHPVESRAIANAIYLGGPATHGSWRCTYVVGEVRSAPLSKQKIREAYARRAVSIPFSKKRALLTALFFDDEWPNELPWFTWESEFASLKNIPDTPYLVYINQKNVPFLGDVRCDD
jgi:hypothetical protein